MKSLPVIHLAIDDDYVVFVPLKREFRELLRPERRSVTDELVDACKVDRLRGHVVPIWINPDNTLEFIAPAHLHERIQAVSVHRLRKNMNRTIVVVHPSAELLEVAGDVGVLREQDAGPAARLRPLVDPPEGGPTRGGRS